MLTGIGLPCADAPVGQTWENFLDNSRRKKDYIRPYSEANANLALAVTLLWEDEINNNPTRIYSFLYKDKLTILNRLLNIVQMQFLPAGINVPILTCYHPYRKHQNHLNLHLSNLYSYFEGVCFCSDYYRRNNPYAPISIIDPHIRMSLDYTIIDDLNY
jgi:hypothetical protein